MQTKKIITILKKDGTGILPTDTLYGIVSSAFSKQAVERIYKIKKRNPKKPLIILISSLIDLKKFGISGRHIRTNRLTLEKFWPGPVSIVFPCTSTVKVKKIKYLHRGTKTLAFRFPKKKSLIKILKQTGPLVAPSANPEGKKPATTIAMAKKYFGDEMDFYMSGGILKNKPSALISIGEKGKIKILR